ncbi:MAG TPA: RNA 2',3'-cyclic phosphodiesterase [Candidatus Aminicenantes bacterium]|nr:RNA 2',3'-cyclic phosphodiesterase [Candidatus Aminicenantes bacterium]
MMRTFIAIELADQLKSTLSSYIRELEQTKTKIRWVKPAGMHLTLKFLGEIDQRKATQVIQELEETIPNYPAFYLTLYGTGTFPPGSRHPKVIWIGIQKEPTLMALACGIEDKMAQLGFTREKRDFTPHLTLGRVKSQAGIHSLIQRLKKDEHKSFGQMRVSKVIFYQSTLKPTGAEYTPLREFSLR